MLARVDTAPPPDTIVFLKGKNDTDANLKHCLPIGIPMIVRHQMIPDRIQAMPLKKPPKTNHRMFPKDFIYSPQTREAVTDKGTIQHRGSFS
jgi:hypothetical protein